MSSVLLPRGSDLNQIYKMHIVHHTRKPTMLKNLNVQSVLFIQIIKIDDNYDGNIHLKVEFRQDFKSWMQIAFYILFANIRRVWSSFAIEWFLVRSERFSIVNENTKAHKVNRSNRIEISLFGAIWPNSLETIWHIHHDSWFFFMK